MFLGINALSKPDTKSSARTSELQKPGVPPIQTLIEQLLVGRLDDMDARGVAAFLAGWCSAVDLFRRTELTMPDASPEVLASIRRLVSAIEAAQRAVLAESEED